MPDATKTSPHLIFLFSSSREKMLSEVREGKGTDTALRGMNHIPGAEYLTIGECRHAAFCSWLLARLPRFIQVMMLVPRLLRYDFVVAQDELFLGYAVSVCARLFLLKTRWVYITMTSSTLLRRHAAHPLRRFLLKKFWASYARIICLSSEQREDLIRFGIAHERLTLIPFGVDADFFRPSDVSREEKLIVSVGRDPGRDYETLFKAVERVAHACIVVTGRRNVPRDMPVPANVSVLYDRNYTEIRDLYARARLMVIASKSTDMPDGSDCSGQTVIMDALAAGKAVIATERPWIDEYFIPGQDLIVVPPSDPEALARAIDSLWHDAGKRKHLAVSGREKVVAHYTTKAFATALRNGMNSIL